MNLFRTILTLGLLLLTVIPIAVSAQTNDGTITGTVVNETTGSAVPGIEVTLSAFTSEGLFAEWSTTANDAGEFSFAEVDTSDGIVYAASVEYEGVLYSGGMIRFQGTTEQANTIPVYDTTTDRSVVSVTSRGLVLSEIDPDTGVATLLDIVALDVEGDKTFVAGDTGRSLEFPVPRTANEVTPMPGFDFGAPVLENAIVYASGALRPDGDSATLRYIVQYTGTAFSVDLRQAYPTGAFRVLIPTSLTAENDAVTVQSAGLEDDGVTQIGGVDYHVWTSGELAADTSLRISFRGLPESAFEPNSLMVKEPALLAAVALVAATGVTAYVVRRKNLVAEPAAVSAKPLPASIIDSRDELIVQLHELQDEHANGLIDDDLYLSERRALLERLRVVSRQLRDAPEPEQE